MGRTDKLSYEYIKEQFNNVGYTLLGDEYINSKIKLRYKCEKHPDKELSITWSNFQQGYRCQYCNKEINKNEINCYSIYVHIFPNGKLYFGITSQDVERRWMNGAGYQSQILMTRAINKYGWDDIEHVILYDNLSKSQVCKLEQDYIKYYNTTNHEFGYNFSTGGEVGNSGCIRNKEWRKKISDSQKGNKNVMYGKHPSEETRLKLSIARKGKHKGAESWNSKTIICVDTGEIFYSIIDASNYYKTNYSHIGECCQHKRKTAGKHQWEYYDKYIEKEGGNHRKTNPVQQANE